jgi:hypothetical protein
MKEGNMPAQKNSSTKLLERLRNVAIELNYLIRYFLKFWFVSLILILLYLTFFSIEQGRDILAAVSESRPTDLRAITSTIMLLILALAVWFHTRTGLTGSIKEVSLESFGKKLKAIGKGESSLSPVVRSVSQSVRSMFNLEHRDEESEDELQQDLDLGYEQSIERIEGPTQLESSIEQRKSRVLENLKYIFPRFCGMLVFLIFGLAALKLYFETHVSDFASLFSHKLFIPLISAGTILLAYLYLKMLNNETRTHDGNARSVTRLIFIICLGFTAVFFFLSAVDRFRPFSFSNVNLFIAFFLGFGLTVRSRVKEIFNWQRIWLEPPFFQKLILFVFLCCVVWFIILNVFVGLTQQIFPLSILFPALVSYVFISASITAAGKFTAFKNFAVLVYLFIIMLFLLPLGSRSVHQLSYAEERAAISANSRMPIEKYLVNWLKARAGQIEKSESYPVYLLTGEGGGSRGAYWSYITMAHLQDQTGQRFSNHLMIASTVSGSSTGLSAFLTKYKENRADPQYRYLSFADSIFSKNYISNSLVRLLGADLWKYLVASFGLDGRGKLLEKEWARGFEGEYIDFGTVNTSELDNRYLAYSPFLSYWYDQDARLDFFIPILVTNTTHVETGKRAFISPLTLDQERNFGNYDFLSYMDEKSNEPYSDGFRMTSAVRLSASFPLISPSSHVKGFGHFVDGGYYDNRGSTTAFNSFSFIRDFFENPDNLRDALDEGDQQILDSLMEHNVFDKIKLTLLILENDVDPEENDGSKQVNQLTVPVRALQNTRGAHTRYMQLVLQSEYDHHVVKLYHKKIINCENNGKSREVRPIMPLARYLSNCARQGMRQNLADPTNAEILHKIVTNVNEVY